MLLKFMQIFPGKGKNYAHFSDRLTYRIGMENLRENTIRSLLATIRNNPHSLDPASVSAEVNAILPTASPGLPNASKADDTKDVAEFLIRCLFTLFAEDMKLIPDKGFHKLPD